LIDTFVGIIRWLKECPRDRKYRQFANDSIAAKTIAAGPPYIKNVKNTAASEKLIANRERGRARVIRGATSVENTRITRNPQLKVADDNSVSANEKQTIAARMTIPLTIFD